jgi:hypothetical protein
MLPPFYSLRFGRIIRLADFAGIFSLRAFSGDQPKRSRGDVRLWARRQERNRLSQIQVSSVAAEMWQGVSRKADRAKHNQASFLGGLHSLTTAALGQCAVIPVATAVGQVRRRRELAGRSLCRDRSCARASGWRTRRQTELGKPDQQHGIVCVKRRLMQEARPAETKWPKSRLGATAIVQPAYDAVPPRLKRNDTSDRFPLMHQIEGVVDLVERHRVGD